MRRQTIVFAVIVFFAGLNAFSYQAPNHFLSGNAGLMGTGLRQSCYALDVAADVLPCNPAFIAKEKERHFNANLSLGNNVSYLKEATDLSQGHANEDSIKKLFTQHEDNELQTQMELGHIQETFGWSVTPALVNYSTSFHNQALPKISLYASLEEVAKLQFGSYWSDDWSYGIQLRYVHRRFVASQFYLTDALVQDGHYLFEPRQQYLFFVEPGVMFAPKDSPLNPEFTLMVGNSGFVNERFAEVPVEPEYHFTSSINPELDYGRFSLGVDVNFNRKLREGPGPLTLGGFYEFGILRLFGSLARDENGIGFGIFNTWWNMGVTHRNESFQNPLDETITISKTYFFLGIEI
ncbi:MAG: hypothetical protein B7Y39_09430 [Bdellovibrio sp. 28-41-41]|nr:MAG: hypothetical protein B7Y39_09430 [Bdellovibrio sp. 28-41-41]